ncbi:SubName: Full=Uncharacterized protein {ECO:0000313/EMBL:CCA70610.1} [Serendipita indica DSM 11827]|uniref:Uncharacterized protein n=1 Tax=Serendipita indica (strain DSM 11827) TaxID=1109443 RepID=G4TH11_SERID|nr:SubName: Full=Uncharacterized protein {ECO:0000313/EMBL:CCA70610.1} [Serendipita indica DSM 11827]CCA70610.1 hypothetical protein PIIN_04547 [Serendipita indica DSM 11827]
MGITRRGSLDALSPTLRCNVEVIASGKGHRATAIVPRPASRRAPSCDTIVSPVASKENGGKVSNFDPPREEDDLILAPVEGSNLPRPARVHRKGHVKKNAPERFYVNARMREQSSPVSDYSNSREVEETPMSPVVDPGDDDWVTSPTGVSGRHRYPSIFEDYYGAGSPIPESPLHTIESLSLSAKRQGVERQTTVDEQNLWGEFWTDAMRRRATEKKSNNALKRTDTLEVSALLKHRRQLVKEGRGREDSIMEEEL